MSKITEELKKHKIYNLYEFYGEIPYIWYRPSGGSRSSSVSAWMVTKHGYRLDDSWYNHGSRAFIVFNRKDKPIKLLEAETWASDKFGIKEWARDPFGGYGPSDFIKTRIKEILEQETE